MPLVPCVGRQAAAEQSKRTPAADRPPMPDDQLRTENWRLTTGDRFLRDRAYQPPLPPSAAQFLLDHREYAQLQRDSSGLEQQSTEEFVPHLPCGRLYAETLRCS